MTTLGVTPWRSLFCALGSSVCGQANIGHRTTEATVIRAKPETRSRIFSGTLLSLFIGSPVAIVCRLEKPPSVRKRMPRAGRSAEQEQKNDWHAGETLPLV